MALFDERQTAISPIQNFVTPKQGVVEEPGGLLALSGLIDTVSGLVDQSNANKANELLADFTEKQLSLIQAVEQGRYTSRFARTAMRQNLLEAVSAYPALREKLLQTNSSIIGQGGMGDIITEGTIEEQRTNMVIDTLVREGRVSPNATDAEINTAANEWMRAAEAKRVYDSQMEELNLRIRSNEVLASDQNAVNRMRGEIASQFLIDSGPAKLQELDTFADSILNDSSLSSADRVRAIEARQAEMLAEIGPYVANIESHKADALMAAFNARIEIYKKMASNEYERDEAEQLLSHNQTSIQNRMFEDGRFALAYGLSKILPNQPLTNLDPVISEVSNAIIQNMGDGQRFNPFSSDPRERLVLREYTNIIGGADKDDPEQLEEQAKHLSSMLDSVTDYEGIVRHNPKAAVELVDYFASDSFLQLMKDHPNNEERAASAASVLRRHFDDEVWGLIREEFTNKQVDFTMQDEAAALMGSAQAEGGSGVAPRQEVTGIVRYEAVADGVRFAPIDPNSDTAVTTAENLNRELRPIINKVVRAAAHLEGRSDYGAKFVELADEMLDPDREVTSTRDNTEGDLDWDAFRQGALNIEGMDEGEISNSLQLTSARAFNTGVAIEPVGMIIHHTGGHAGGDGNLTGLVSDMGSRNVSAHFVIDRNGIVHQTVPDDQMAWHAGRYNTSGYDNRNTIGVEIVAHNDGDVLPIQVEAAQRLIATMSEKWGFDPMTRVFGHGEVASHKQETEGSRVLSSIAKTYRTQEEIQLALEDGSVRPGQIINFNGRLIRVG